MLNYRLKAPKRVPLPLQKLIMEIKAGVLLKEINSPDDLKKLSREQLHQVCDELRQYIIDVVSV